MDFGFSITRLAWVLCWASTCCYASAYGFGFAGAEVGASYYDRVSVGITPGTKPCPSLVLAAGMYCCLSSIRAVPVGCIGGTVDEYNE